MKSGTIGITVFFIAFFSAANLSWAGLSDFDQDAAEIGQEFAESALENVEASSGSDVSDAVARFKSLANDGTLLSVSPQYYQYLGAHGAFGAELAEEMMRGGATTGKARSALKKLAATYGKGFVGVINGESVALLSEQFMMDLRMFVSYMHLDPENLDHVFRTARGQFGALAKALR
ncbi:MAG: hypothetical protein PHE61_03645 [Candidatus Omnitrophica bacterium]|nr:hypothetical protein [Candidatus Omnitrophota bacterium]